MTDSVSDLDADGMLLYDARSDAGGLDAFRDHHYDKDIGLGVYDIHSPRVPPVAEMAGHLRQATAMLDGGQVHRRSSTGNVRRHTVIIIQVVPVFDGHRPPA